MCERERETDRQTETETETERQTDRQTDRQRDTETHRESACCVLVCVSVCVRARVCVSVHVFKRRGKAFDFSVVFYLPLLPTPHPSTDPPNHTYTHRTPRNQTMSHSVYSLYWVNTSWELSLIHI